MQLLSPYAVLEPHASGRQEIRNRTNGGANRGANRIGGPPVLLRKILQIIEPLKAAILAYF